MGGTTDGHALSVAELAAHEHQEQATSSPGGGPTSPVRVAGSGGLGFSTIFIDSVGSNVTNSTPLNTTTVGSGTAHTHPLSGSATFTGNAIALNLKYNDFIIATKN
jgi:hypothetical protein